MRKRICLILIALLASLAVSVCSSFAQDIDISNMDNAQLMAMLQAIMQKLDDSSQQAEGSGQESVIRIQDAEEAGVRIFNIYENKKLILERLPDYMFYQPPTEVPEEPQPEKDPTPKPKPDCFWTCWDDLGFYADCEWICM